VKSKDEWARRRTEIQAAVLHYQYGTLPPAPTNTTAVEIISHNFKPFQAVHKQFKVTTGPDNKLTFMIDLAVPPGKGPFPVIIRGDACWGKLDDTITAAIVKRGYILADFNRCEFAPDNKSRETGMYTLYPDHDFAAVAAWAWGFARVVDVLEKLDYVDKTKIIATGHSRGGKAALLAGALDTRIALTAPNNSGCGGAGCYRFQAPKSEAIENITKSFPFWFTPRFREFIGQVDKLPIDQHSVKALVAPRALLTTEALGDLWANPQGTLQSHQAAKEVFKFLGVENNIGIFYREGGHAHRLDDFEVLMDFADVTLVGKKNDRNFNPNPFPEAAKAYSWSVPN
jgi:hypothetical protein